MQVHTFHPNNVHSSSQRVGGRIEHHVMGPYDAVIEYLHALDRDRPDAVVTTSVAQAGRLEVVVHMPAVASSGTAIAAEEAVT